MRSLRPHRSIARFFSPWRFLAVVAGTLLLIFIIAFAGKALQNYQLHQQAEALGDEILALQNEKAELENVRAYCQTDAYVERAAPEERHWTKPGEIYLVVVQDAGGLVDASPALPGDPAPQSPDPAPAIVDHDEPYWPAWWGLFFDSELGPSE